METVNTQTGISAGKKPRSLAKRILNALIWFFPWFLLGCAVIPRLAGVSSPLPDDIGPPAPVVDVIFRWIMPL